MRIGHEPVALEANMLALGGAGLLLTVLLVALGTRLLFGREPAVPPDLPVEPSLSAARGAP